CYKQWSSAVVSWDGQVAPCCYDKDLDYSPGNIRQVPLPELWKGKKMQDFRNQVLTNKARIEMCRNCPEGRKWLI
ncbi:MAG TPA: SPASM domain-containing protein, partial [Bacteroidales bacterium]|nr:SPASM domain-containing protein [Bacteroidales bacterium]